jgi:hypothetical protein
LNQHVFWMQAVAVRLERQHQLEKAVVKAHDRVSEGRSRLSRLLGYPIHEARVLAVRVHPQHEPLLAHLFGDLREQRSADDAGGHLLP